MKTYKMILFALVVAVISITAAVAVFAGQDDVYAESTEYEYQYEIGQDEYE